MPSTDVHGPIDFVLIEFTGDRLTGGPADALVDLVDRSVIRVYDLLVVRKDYDGSVTGVDISDLSADAVGGFTVLAGARSGLLGDADARQAGDAMEPGTVAALIVYENVWAIPFVAAARDAGGEVIASARIPAQDIIDALDAIETVQ